MEPNSNKEVNQSHTGNGNAWEVLSSGTSIDRDLIIPRQGWNDGLSSENLDRTTVLPSIETKAISKPTKIVVKEPVDILKFDKTVFSAGKSVLQKDRLRVESILMYIDSVEPKTDTLQITASKPEDVQKVFSDVVYKKMRALVVQEKQQRIIESFYPLLEEERQEELERVGIGKTKSQNDALDELWINRRNWFRFWKQRANIEVVEKVSGIPNHSQHLFTRNLTWFLFYVDMIGRILCGYHTGNRPTARARDINSTLLNQAFQMALQYSPDPSSLINKRKHPHGYRRRHSKLEVVWQWLHRFINSLDNHPAFQQIFFPRGCGGQIPNHTQGFFNYISTYSIKQLNQRLVEYYDHIDHCQSNPNTPLECFHQTILVSSSALS
ncbi:hypothetical protein PGTUg99_025799 [Puccinia graminis f. sp. tritici]|uniref:Uncharacterized protein n=1 Tax=Puccinia graminis f. sp. tritici TaxID=56615 RepID=A0A5B0SLX0_PUCGR|nr:hypothetical protein PGTUg99_025799 [Puccinia graminis f. sp. tritici]